MYKQLFIGLLIGGVSTLACRKSDSSSSGAQLAGQADAPLQVTRGLRVARGLGGMGSLRNTNSLEALECNHERGFRWFEVDLSLTADNELVCFHKGDEKLAELPESASKLPSAALEGKKYAGRFGITSLPILLGQTERLGDVVLVLDTGRWSKRMQGAVAAVLGGADKGSRRTRVVLQAYEERELAGVAKLAAQTNAGIMMNLDRTSADDETVAKLAKKYSVLAVVSDKKRFTPFLADRLHKVEVPILVHTLNEHRDVVTFTRAGADGFYTDGYVPYETMAATPATAEACGVTPGTERNPWAERDAMQPRQFRLRSCAKRRPHRIDLIACDEQPAIYGGYLGVSAGHSVHVELEALAGDEDASLWLELADAKTDALAKPREELRLKHGERQTWQYDVVVPQGTEVLEARLGVPSKKDRVSIRRFKIADLQAAPSGNGAASSVQEEDAGGD